MVATLNDVARALVAPGKGILAADESSGTIKKRFDSIGCESTEDRRRVYRELLFTTKGASDFVSGVILFDETIRQNGSDGRPLPEGPRRARNHARHQGRQGHDEVVGFTRRARHRRPRRIARPPRGVPRSRRAVRQVARRHRHQGRRDPDVVRVVGQRARARALRRAVPGRRHRPDRRARGADGRRPLRRAVLRGHARRPCTRCSASCTNNASTSRACCSSPTW